MALFCSFLRHCCDAARKHEWERLLFKNENSRFETLLLVYPMRCVMALNFLLHFSSYQIFGTWAVCPLPSSVVWVLMIHPPPCLHCGIRDYPLIAGIELRSVRAR